MKKLLLAVNTIQFAPFILDELQYFITDTIYKTKKGCVFLLRKYGFFSFQESEMFDFLIVENANPKYQILSSEVFFETAYNEDMILVKNTGLTDAVFTMLFQMYLPKFYSAEYLNSFISEELKIGIEVLDKLKLAIVEMDIKTIDKIIEIDIGRIHFRMAESDEYEIYIDLLDRARKIISDQAFQEMSESLQA